MIAALLAAIFGGFLGAAASVIYLDWGTPGAGQAAHIDPTRADFVDLLLSLVVILLAAVGVTVTVGALVVGAVAFKTLREIKDDAAKAANDATAAKIKATMDSDLEPNVNDKIRELLPSALRSTLLDDVGHRILTDMAKRGELDEVVERAAVRMQSGGPESDQDDDS